VKVPDAGSWNDEASPGPFSHGTFISDRVKARIAAGECLIAEAATVAEAAVVVIGWRIKTAHDNVYDHPWGLGLDTVTADRLSVYELRGVEVPREVFRRTAIEAYPIFALLWIGMQERCGGGVCHTRLAIWRMQSRINSNDLREFFKTKSGLSVAAVDDLPNPSIAALAAAALADTSLPADSPNLKLVDRYVKSLAVEGGSQEDVDLLRRILADARTTDFSFLPAAVRKLGESAAPLVGPLVQRISVSELPRDRSLVQSLAGAVENLPDGAARNAMPELRALANDKRRGTVAWRALVRLADAGEASVPILLSLVDAGKMPHAPGGGEVDLLVAGLKGLCRLGPEGKASTPALVEFIEGEAASRNRLSSHLKSTGELAVAALARQDADQELEHFIMVHEDLRDQVSRRVRQEKASPLNRACYY